MTQIHLFFQKLLNYLTNEIAPISYRLDSSRECLKIAYNQLISLGNLGFLVPRECGGLGGERRERIDYNILMAEYSGALLFLCTQHQFAISQLKKLPFSVKIQETLKNALAGQGMGIGLAANKKIFQIERTKTGFLLSGQLRWVTGFDYFSHVLCSFDIDNTVYYLLLPFEPIQLANAAIVVSAPIQTSVFSSANTVSLTFKDWLVDMEEIIAVTPLLEKSSHEHPAIYNFLGIANASLKLAAYGKYENLPMAKITLSELQKSCQQYYTQIIKGEGCSYILRAEGLELAEKCLKFARVVCGSDVLLSEHPISRMSREIGQYMIAGYSIEQCDAYLSTIRL